LSEVRPQLSDHEYVEPFIDPDTQKMIVRSVKGANSGTARTEAFVRNFPPLVIDEPDTVGGTNTGPTPFEFALGALIGCEGVMISNVASAMGFEYEGVDFESSGQFDLRGPKGVPGVRPFFEEVDLEIKLYTEEPPERVDKLAKNVEHRCPVLNLMRDGGVKVNVTWTVL